MRFGPLLGLFGSPFRRGCPAGTPQVLRTKFMAATRSQRLQPLPLQSLSTKAIRAVNWRG